MSACKDACEICGAGRGGATAVPRPLVHPRTPQKWHHARCAEERPLGACTRCGLVVYGSDPHVLEWLETPQNEGPAYKLFCQKCAHVVSIANNL